MSKFFPKELMPSDPLMVGAWASALIAHLKTASSLDLYQKETGDKYKPANTPMDRLIAESTDQDREFLIRYIKWFNKAFWGPLDTKAGG